jgi:hypothetical protein
VNDFEAKPSVQKFTIRRGSKESTVHRHVVAVVKTIKDWKENGISPHCCRYFEVQSGTVVINFLKTHHGIDVVRSLAIARSNALTSRAHYEVIVQNSNHNKVSSNVDNSDDGSSSDGNCDDSTSHDDGTDDGTDDDSTSHDDSTDDDRSSSCYDTEVGLDDSLSDVENAPNADLAADCRADGEQPFPAIPSVAVEDVDLTTDGEFVQLELQPQVEEVFFDLRADNVIAEERKRQFSLRQVLEIFAAHETLSEELLNRLLSLFRELKPVMPTNWEKEVPKDARTLRKRYARKLIGKFVPYKIPAGLSTKNGIPMKNSSVKENMLKRLRETGSTVDKTSHEVFGDAAYFGVRDCLFMESPGNTHVKNYMRTLQRVHAANPYLLSPKFLKLVDKPMWIKERDEAWRSTPGQTPLDFHPKRPKFNCFYLRLFIDGVQIANNSSAPSALPVAFSIERIVPYYPDRDDPVAFYDGVIIPVSFAQPCVALSFHGPNKPCLHEYTRPLAEEFERHEPDNRTADRDVIFDFRCLIADCPMVSLASGKFFR